MIFLQCSESHVIHTICMIDRVHVDWKSCQCGQLSL